MKVGLYSITYLGLWYDGPALSLEDLLARAKAYGYDGVEIDGKRPHGNPLDLPAARCRELRRRAADAGVEIYALAANNDFSSPVPEHRECQLVYLRELSRAAADLGAGVVRVFAAWPGVTRTHHPPGGAYKFAGDIWQHTHRFCTDEEAFDWCRECLAEAARLAGEFGVTLALQNHPPVTNTWRDTLSMVRQADSPHLKLCLDAPLLSHFETLTAEQIREAALEAGPLQVLSHFGGEYLAERPDGTVKGGEFYLPFARAMNEIGYGGYIGYELCHPLPVSRGRRVGVEHADTCARLAAKFMRQVLAQA